MSKDLTVGKPESVLWKFCLPLFGSIVFQQLYNIADSFIAGKLISNSALAAIGNSYEITLIFIAFAFGCNIGASVVAAQLFGAKRYGELKTSVYTSLIISGTVCVILMITGITLCDKLLVLIKTPAEIFNDSKQYMDIYIMGLPFVFLYNVSTGIFSALGDSRTPFIFLVCSSVANVGADILFVTAFGMGVVGLAWATFICQGVSCILALLFIMLQLRALKTSEKSKPFSPTLAKQFAVVAIPSVLQQSFISVGNIIIQGVVNSFETQAIAGYSAAVKLNNLVTTSLMTVGNGISNFAAQNLGAGKYDRIKSGFKSGLKMAWILCVPIFAAYFFGANTLVGLFMETPTGEAVDIGVEFLRIVSPFYFLISCKLVADGILRGTGLMKQFMIATLTDLTIRVILACILSQTALKTTGIWISWPVGWVIATILSVGMYLRADWKSIAKKSKTGIKARD